MPKGCVFDGSLIELTGTVSRETFPGPPNYTSIDDGDEPQTVWVLTVEEARPICGESMEDGKPYFVANVRRFQLVLDEAQYAKHASAVFNAANVKGQLWVAQTGHHHTKALLKVETLTLPLPSA